MVAVVVMVVMVEVVVLLTVRPLGVLKLRLHELVAGRDVVLDGGVGIAEGRAQLRDSVSVS
jgi:hypothetical protein